MTTIISGAQPGRGIANHSGGAYDGGARQDLLDTWPFHNPITFLSGSGDAIPPNVAAQYLITTAGVDAMTLVAPASGGPLVGGSDGLMIAIVSNTAHAHTLTATGLLQTGASGTGVLTMAADAGCTIVLRAYQGLWQLISSNGITVTS
jgi:hypothetical protein